MGLKCNVPTICNTFYILGPKDVQKPTSLTRMYNYLASLQYAMDLFFFLRKVKELEKCTTYNIGDCY